MPGVQRLIRGSSRSRLRWRRSWRCSTPPSPTSLLPHIAGSLSAGQDESTWVLTSYLVSNAIVLPLSGWLSSIVGRKNFYMGCVALFTVSSFMCGLAPNLADPDHLPRSARRGRRRIAAQRAGDSRRHVSSRQTRHGICGLWHGGGHGAGDRPNSGRMDHRQLHLALDFLHQYSGRNSFDPAHLAPDSGSALLQAPQAERDSDRLRRPGICRLGPGSFADCSRQGPARRLVRIELHRHAFADQRGSLDLRRHSGSGGTKIPSSICICSATEPSASRIC